MTKFGTTTAPQPTGPTSTTTRSVTTEGGSGWSKDLISELFLLMSTDFAAEPTFYESPSDRLSRLQALVRDAAKRDPEMVASMIPWIRNEANMRSVAIVAACEYAAALRNSGIDHPPIRRVVSSACSRADEPAEVLGYWWRFYGRRLPMGVKRGIADAAARLYTQRAAIKWNGSKRPIRFQDVIQITRPKPKTFDQSRLFKWLLDSFYDTGEPSTAYLSVLSKAAVIDRCPEGDRRELLATLDPAEFTAAGYTWERLAGWLPGGMDAAAWEAIIPSMGYMALLRNLRNFEKAGISAAAQTIVADKLTNPDEIAASRQLPFRFWSAFKHSGTTRFAHALEVALETIMSIPRLRGSTLVAVDVSASMDAPMSGKSSIARWEAGAVFAAGLRGSSVDVIAYGTHWAPVKTEVSALRTVQNVEQLVKTGEVGHGTNTWNSVSQAYHGHDRVVVFTDMQDHPGNTSIVPDRVPIYVWDLSGYSVANIEVGSNRHLLGGLSDKSFQMIELLEQGLDASWPWEMSR